MTASRTRRVSASLSAIAAAIAVSIVACPSHHKSKPCQPILVSGAVTPTNPTIALGTTQQFTATGTYSNGTTVDLTALVDWSSSDATAGALSTAIGSQGQATGLGMGSTTITASYSDKGGSTTLTVTNAALLSIEVTPTNPHIALGTSAQFAATGILTDGTTQDLTAQVDWESSATGTSTVSNDAGTHGLALSDGLGDTMISATL